MKSTLMPLPYCCSDRRVMFASLVVVTLAMAMPILLGANSTQPAKAIALFQVNSNPHTFSGEGNANAVVQSFDVFKKTQLAKLKANYVLTAAIRTPGVAGLSILTNEKDPVEWLDQHLTADFPQDGEVLRLTLSANGPPDQVVTILNAVAKAYQDEVVSEERQRSVGNRDLLQRSLNELNKEIKDKLNDYLAMMSNADIAISNDDVKQQIALRQLDRIDAEIMRIESAQVLSTTKDADEHVKNVEEWLAQLQKRRSDLARRISERAMRSADFETRKDDITQLQRLANDMSMKLAQFELEVSGPERIRMLQPAVLSAK